MSGSSRKVTATPSSTEPVDSLPNSVARSPGKKKRPEASWAFFPSSPVLPNLHSPVCDTFYQTPKAGGSLGPPDPHIHAW